MLPIGRRVAAVGAVNALAQAVLKIGSPGVSDFYQGTELWDLNLVDPDNRRPVNFAVRSTLLAEVDAILRLPVGARAPAIASLLEAWPDGRIKLLVTAAGLRLRRQREALFLEGEYLPLVTETTVNADLVAFARVHGDDVIIVSAPRLTAPLVGVDLALPLGGAAWKTSRVILPPPLDGRTFRHEITGAEIRPHQCRRSGVDLRRRAVRDTSRGAGPRGLSQRSRITTGFSITRTSPGDCRHAEPVATSTPIEIAATLTAAAGACEVDRSP